MVIQFLAAADPAEMLRDEAPTERLIEDDLFEQETRATDEAYLHLPQVGLTTSRVRVLHLATLHPAACCCPRCSLMECQGLSEPSTFLVVPLAVGAAPPEGWKRTLR